MFGSVLTWMNSNSGFVMAITTIVYTVFTLLLVIQNKRALEETKRQFNEANRGRIFPSLVKIADSKSDLFCLKFENPTNSPVEKVKIGINQDWLSQYDNISTNGEGINNSTKKSLEAINSAGFIPFMPKQTMYYSICLVPAKAYEKLSEKTLEITINYLSRAKTEEKYVFDLKAMGTQLTSTSDYVRLEREHISALEKIKNSIDQLEEVHCHPY